MEHKYLYHHPEFTLSVIHQDSLRLHNRDKKTFEGFPDELKKADEVYELDRKHDIVGLEGQKRQVYDFVKDCRDFDYVCANPPYIREDDHKELFRLTVKEYPYWKQYYQGKMDYLYFFIILGLSKLREGAKLGFITTAYFPTAAGASKLRKYILENTRILEVIDFGTLKFFEAAPGQFNHVFVLERCTNKDVTDGSRILTVKVKEPLPGTTNKEVIVNTLAHIQRHIGKGEFSDGHLEIHYSPLLQGELTENYWVLFPTKDEFSIIQAIEQRGAQLSEICDSFQGLVTGADVVTKENVRFLSDEAMANCNIKIGDGIFYLTSEQMESLNLSEAERRLIKPIHKAAGIESYLAEETGERDNLFVIYLTKDVEIKNFPSIENHLQKFMPILMRRRECKEGKLSWFSLHWARDQRIFEEEKIVSSIWPERNSFGYSRHSYYLERNAFLTLKKSNIDESLKYILSILNSSLIHFWFEQKASRRGNKYFLPKNVLETIPIRRINFDEPKEIRIHDRLVELVNNIIEAKKNLASYDRLFSKARLTRLHDSDRLPEISDEEIVKAFESSSLRIIRTHPQVRYQPKNPEHFFVKSIKEAEDTQSVVITSKDKQKITLTAPKAVLAYLQRILPNYIGREWGQIINQVFIPTQPDLFDKRREEIVSEVTNLRQKIKVLQKEIDSIVFDLYDLSQQEREIITKAVS